VIDPLPGLADVALDHAPCTGCDLDCDEASDQATRGQQREPLGAWPRRRAARSRRGCTSM
jgi:hypothetical protein